MATQMRAQSIAPTYMRFHVIALNFAIDGRSHTG
jgi:hypothetical protein